MKNEFLDSSVPDTTRRFRVGNSDVEFGRFSYHDKNFLVKEWGEGASLTIGSFCSIAANVTVLMGGNHRLDWISTFPFGHINQELLGSENAPGHPATKGDILIGHDVWIGWGTTILSGVTIGDGAAISAGALVNRNVEPYEVVGGNPIRHIRHRFEPEITRLLLQLRWWEFSLPDIRNLVPQLTTKPDEAQLKLTLSRMRPSLFDR